MFDKKYLHNAKDIDKINERVLRNRYGCSAVKMRMNTKRTLMLGGVINHEHKISGRNYSQPIKN